MPRRTRCAGRSLAATLGFGLAVLARLASAQTPLSAEFQVNTYTPNYQYSASAAPAAGGGFVVTWSSYGSSGSDNGGDQSIHGQRYGLPVAPPTSIPVPALSAPLASLVAMLLLGVGVALRRSA